jgi:hypothetical protein
MIISQEKHRVKISGQPVKNTGTRAIELDQRVKKHQLKVNFKRGDLVGWIRKGSLPMARRTFYGW